MLVCLTSGLFFFWQHVSPGVLGCGTRRVTTVLSCYQAELLKVRDGTTSILLTDDTVPERSCALVTDETCVYVNKGVMSTVQTLAASMCAMLLKHLAQDPSFPSFFLLSSFFFSQKKWVSVVSIARHSLLLVCVSTMYRIKTQLNIPIDPTFIMNIPSHKRDPLTDVISLHK